MEMVLYQIVNRELANPRRMVVPAGTVDFDSWLKSQGYGKNYTLRRGIVRELTKAERIALQRGHDRLKAAGKLPSAATTIASKLIGR